MSTERTSKTRGLLGNSIALLAMTHITAALGYVFWVVCARLASPSVIGVSNTVISAMTLVAILVAAGFLPMLARVLPGADPQERSGLCSTAFVATAVLSGVTGVGAALLLPRPVHDAVGTGWMVALLSAGAMGTAVSLVANAALLGVRRAELSLVAAVVGSVSRLVFAGAIVTSGLVATGAALSAAHAILVVWVASVMLSVGLSLWLLARATPGFRFRPGFSWFNRLRRSVGWDHIATLAVRSPPLVIPIIAAAMFPPAQVGYMTMTALVSSPFLAVASSVSNALLADCADDPRRLRTQIRRASLLIGGLLVVPVVIACLLAPQVLGLFGPEYAHYSALLVLLLLATFPDALINVTVAILRVQRQLVSVAGISVIGATVSIGGAWLLMPHLGIIGAGWSALVSQLMVATTLVVVVYRRFAAGHPEPARQSNPSTDQPTPRVQPGQFVPEASG